MMKALHEMRASLKAWWKQFSCVHADTDNVHQDACCSVERCRSCGADIHYGR